MDFSWQLFCSLFLLAVFAGTLGADKQLDINDANTSKDEDTLATIDYRLPRSVIPLSYEILLGTNLESTFDFYGWVKIAAIAREDTNIITLHSKNLTCYVEYVRTAEKDLIITGTKEDLLAEKFIITVNDTINTGAKIEIFIKFQGVLNDEMVGFYRSSYFDANGRQRWLAATQFEAPHARRAFPCFDEPDLKANFTIRIEHKDNYGVLSNMPIDSIKNLGDSKSRNLDTRFYYRKSNTLDLRLTTFKPTVRMSTYLVAFAVCDFHTLGGNKFMVLARPNAIGQAQYANQIGPKALKYLEVLFDQEYQLPQLKMIAIPDFAAGAMENWGLITYRESRMLYDRQESSDSAQQSIAEVIAHEMTHSWFGNSLTPVWWSFLWLSEAFARYFQYFATAEIETTWNLKEQFVVSEHQVALSVDGLENSHPMTREVASPSEISGMFDQITYSKGASVVRMMKHAFGSSAFDKALRDYLKRHRSSAVTPKDLFSALQDQVNGTVRVGYPPVSDVMLSWTTQPGFPVVNVSISRNGSVTLTQQRFLLRNLANALTNLTWSVPITWATKTNPDFGRTTPKHWLQARTNTISINTPPSDWIIFNVHSSGFYRVNYDTDSWYRIINVLSSDYSIIPAVDRAAIIDDLLNLARAEMVDYRVALTGLQYISRESNYLPFKSAFAALHYLNRRFSGYDEYAIFKSFVLKLIEGTYKKIGYLDRPSDDRLTVHLRRLLNQWACKYDHEGCVKTFLEEFRKFRLDGKKIKPNQRTAAYCTAIRHGNNSDWEFLWNQYRNSNVASDQSVMLEALGCSQNRTILDKYLLSAISGFETSRIRKQDAPSVFSAVYGTGTFGAMHVMDFVSKYHKEMSKYFGTGTISSILGGASQQFSTKALVNRFAKFIEDHSVDLSDIHSSLMNHMKIAEYELQWYSRNSKSIALWIREFLRPTENTLAYRLTGQKIS